MKSAARLILFALLVSLVSGCVAIVSEAQKAEARSAPSSVVIDGTEMRLDIKMSQSPKEKGLDVNGTITLTASNGRFPAQMSINRFALKPSWKGWPGYFFMNFVRQNGDWVLPGAYGNDANFFATDQIAEGKYVITFVWRNRARGLGKKPEHFAAYDVAVTISDGSGKRYLLAQLAVPTK